jgi:nucleotide-binding universal stress UspA family protein
MKVLFATDGEKAADHAELLLKELGDRDRITVTALSVLQNDILVPHPPDGFMRRALVERQQFTQRLVECAGGRLSDVGFEVDTQMREGDPGEELIGSIEEEHIELTVMGAGSHNWLRHVLLGSTSTHILHRSPSSVMIVHDFDGSNGRAQILFCSDGSDGSTVALDTLMGFADAARCQVRVMSVVKRPPMAGFPPAHEAAYLEALAKYEKKQLEELNEEAHGHARSAVSRLEQAGFEASSSVVNGYPNEEILSAAETGEIDLVVVGSRGLGPVKRAFLGSVSDHVARLSRAALVGRRPGVETDA